MCSRTLAIVLFFICIACASQHNNYNHQTYMMNLGIVSPRIIVHSNKSTIQMHQSLRFIALRSDTAQHVSAILMPIIRSL